MVVGVAGSSLDYAYVHSYLAPPSPLGWVGVAWGALALVGWGRVLRPSPAGSGPPWAPPAPCPPAGVALCWGRACGGASLPPGAAPCWGFPGWVGFPPFGAPSVVPPGPLGCGVRASGDDNDV